MAFRNFRFVTIFRILLLTATIFLFFYTITLEYFITPFLVGLIIIFQIYLLFKYIDKTNRDLAGFLESIRFSEFTRSFKIEGLGSSFDELNKAFNDVIHDFQKVRSEKEEQYQYLQALVKNIDVSIITYQRDGEVDMVNNAFKKLFQIATIKNIKDLTTISPELVKTLLNFEPGKNCLVKVQEEDDILQLSISGTEFKIHHKSILLVTIKNIQSVLEDQETESWQKLIRVLTHEIMNSITPISSITSTLDLMFKDAERNKSIPDMETIEEVHMAIKTIHKRSNGLLHFVNTYRNLTKIPKPNFRIALRNKILVIGVILLGGFLTIRRMQAANATPQYITEPVERADIIEVVSETGSIDSSGRADVFSTSTGIIEEIYVDTGDSVAINQNLFKVRSTATDQEKAASWA
ncbi:MAG TPA: hypothetical protein VK982_10395, partial [Bacteroidales bacterium]|nr:hypothetical protein [Bacteroidales bacterium]